MPTMRAVTRRAAGLYFGGRVPSYSTWGLGFAPAAEAGGGGGGGVLFAGWGAHLEVGFTSPDCGGGAR
jgi:hypothetical protein